MPYPPFRSIMNVDPVELIEDIDRHRPRPNDRVPACCPECHTPHRVAAHVVGMADWNLCPKCDQAEGERIRAILRGRGVSV